MKKFIVQLKWQFLLLQKNNIISISFGVTFIYGLLFYFLKGMGSADAFLVSLVLNDPAVIGYFFVALAIYTEIKHQILPAIFITSLNIHTFILSKTVSISIIGLICSLGLAISVKGVNFDVLSFSVGAMGICVISTLLGIFMLTFTNDFLKFAMISLPVFLIFFNVPVLQYLGVINMGLFKYVFPIQGGLDLIDTAISGASINYGFACASVVISVPLLYWLAFYRFSRKVVYQ